MQNLNLTTKQANEFNNILMLNIIYLQFWQYNGGIINKWIRGIKMTPEELDIFKKYVNKCYSMFIPTSERELLDNSNVSVDDLIFRLLEEGIDIM